MVVVVVVVVGAGECRLVVTTNDHRHDVIIIHIYQMVQTGVHFPSKMKPMSFSEIRFETGAYIISKSVSYFPTATLIWLKNTIA